MQNLNTYAALLSIDPEEAERNIEIVGDILTPLTQELYVPKEVLVEAAEPYFERGDPYLLALQKVEILSSADIIRQREDGSYRMTPAGKDIYNEFFGDTDEIGTSHLLTGGSGRRT